MKRQKSKGVNFFTPWGSGLRKRRTDHLYKNTYRVFKSSKINQIKTVMKVKLKIEKEAPK